MKITATTRATRVTVQVGRQGAPGPMGPIGSFTPAGVLVYDYTDLPSPVGGVITLASDLYELMDEVVLPENVRIEAPGNVAVVGRAPLKSRIVGSYDGPLFKLTSASPGNARLFDLRIENQSTGASSRALAVDSPTTTLSISDSSFAGAAGAADFVNASVIKVDGVTFTSSISDSRPVRLLGTITAAAFEYCQAQSVGAGAKLFALEATCVVVDLSMLRMGLVFTHASQSGIYVADGATVTTATLERVVRFGAAGLVNEGWDQTTPQWSALSVATLPDSAVGGASYATGPFTVTFPIANVYRTVAPAAGSPWTLDTDSERFSLVDATTGRIRYIGTDRTKVLIVGAVVAYKSGTNVASKIGVHVNGALHAGAEGYADVTTRATTRSIAPSFHVLSPNDEIDVRIANIDNTDSFTIVGGSIAVVGGNVS